MFGAIAGDVIGSYYEGYPTKRKDFQLFSERSQFTDDTVMTIATADTILSGAFDYSGAYQRWGQKYPSAGYGGKFASWIWTKNPAPYGSYGNGSAMRVSPVAWAYNTMDEVLIAAKESAEVTHNHPEGIKGAQSIAASVFMARKGRSKEEIKDFVSDSFGYDLDRTLDEIRPGYSFDLTCQGSVPEAIIAFIEAQDFEESIRNAVSLGGDSDTLAAIAGGMAEAFYGGVPDKIRKETLNLLTPEMIEIINAFEEMFGPSARPVP